MEESQPPARPAARTAPGQPQPPARGAEAATEKLQVLGTAGDPATPRPGNPAPRAAASSQSVAAVDQLWLRCAVVIACAIGVAMVAIGVGTYLMAVDSNASAWVFFGLAGLLTLGMPAVPWFYLRELRAVFDKSG